MPITEPFVGAPTVSTTEWSFTNNSTTLTAQTNDGVYQIWFDVMANLVAGDQFRFRVYEKINGSGATQRPVWEMFTPLGAQSINIVLPSLILIDGWEVTGLRTAGADRVIPFSIRRVA